MSKEKLIKRFEEIVDNMHEHNLELEAVAFLLQDASKARLTCMDSHKVSAGILCLLENCGYNMLEAATIAGSLNIAVGSQVTETYLISQKSTARQMH